MLLYSNTIIALKNKILDLSLLNIEYSINKSKIYDNSVLDNVNIFYSLSYNNQSFTDFRATTIDIDGFDAETIQNNEGVYVKFMFKNLEIRDTAPTIYIDKNVEFLDYTIDLKAITYNNVQIDISSIDNVSFETEENIIIQKPFWNLYDNHFYSIKRWVAQCNALSEMYGHSCIYFKTTPTDTIDTLRQNDKREVTDIKRIKILIVNNAIGNVDKMIYSDWDMPLQDDFITNIIVDKFREAFGETELPSEKDYLYLPLLNKMFRISTVQPVNGYMGKIAWWEVNLIKYETDATITINNELRDSLSQEIKDSIPGFNNIYATSDLLNTYGNETLENQYVGAEYDDYIKSVEKHIDVSENNSEKIGIKTVQEKRDVTDYYTNVLTDAHISIGDKNYIRLKESDKFREFYNKRLNIVDVSINNSLFPITMYNCQISDNTKQTTALQYSIDTFTEVSKVSTIAKNKYIISFDIAFFNLDKLVLNTEYSIFLMGDITYFKFKPIEVATDGVTELKAEVYIVNEKISTSNGSVLKFQVSEKELYNIYYCYSKITDNVTNENSYCEEFDVFTIVNKIETQVCNIVNYYESTNVTDTFGSEIIQNLYIFGGQYLLGNIYFKIDNNEIFKDTCRPLMEYRNV